MEIILTYIVYTYEYERYRNDIETCTEAFHINDIYEHDKL